jgi:tripartite-type tricarboxylate transporter receptor subunit TctC
MINRDRAQKRKTTPYSGDMVNFLRAPLLLLLAGWLAAAASAWAQYPEKPIRLIVAWPAGGPTDTIARIMAQKLGDSFGQQVFVENKPGAAGMIGSAESARSPADGYTMSMAVVQDVTRPSFMPKVSFDIAKDLEPVIKVYDLPFIITVNPQVFQVSSLKDIIEFAKANPGKLQYASPSNGSVGHLSFELIKQLAGFEAGHVPYKGSAPAINDLLGGQIPMMYGDMVSALPHIKSGRIKAIAVSTARRVPALPDVPTVSESGFDGFLGVAWGGLVVPAGVPAATKDRLYKEAAKALSSDDVKQRIRALGVEPAPVASAEDFGAFMRSEMAKWGKLINDRGIQSQ